MLMEQSKCSRLQPKCLTAAARGLSKLDSQLSDACQAAIVNLNAVDVNKNMRLHSNERSNESASLAVEPSPADCQIAADCEPIAVSSQS